MMSEFQLDGCVRAPDLPLFAANIQIVITCRLTSRRSGVLISPALIRLIRGAARTGLKCCWLWLSSEPADCHQLQTSHADDLHKLKSCTNRKQVYRRRYESRRSSKPKLHLKIRKNEIWWKTIFNMADGIITPCNVACGSAIIIVNSPSGSTLQCDT